MAQQNREKMVRKTRETVQQNRGDCVAKPREDGTAKQRENLKTKQREDDTAKQREGNTDHTAKQRVQQPPQSPTGHPFRYCNSYSGVIHTQNCNYEQNSLTFSKFSLFPRPYKCKIIFWEIIPLKY